MLGMGSGLVADVMVVVMREAWSGFWSCKSMVVVSFVGLIHGNQGHSDDNERGLEQIVKLD